MMRRDVLAGVLCLLLVVMMGATACGKKKVAPPPPAPPAAPAAAAPAPPPSPPPPPPAPAPTPPPAALSEEEIFARASLDELNTRIKPLADVFFDLDESTVREDGRTALQKNADWMKKFPSTKITVEGHCDSRGSAEYNLGLGERRASAVKSYLGSLGIGGDRVNTVSKGKEQPFCSEENEACWSQNRRGHFIITAK